MDSVWKLLNWGHASLGRGRVDNAYSWSGIVKSLHQILWPMFLKHFYVGTGYVTKIWFVVVPRPLDGGGAESTFKILLMVMTVHRAKFSISSYSS